MPKLILLFTINNICTKRNKLFANFDNNSNLPSAYLKIESIYILNQIKSCYTSYVSVFVYSYGFFYCSNGTVEL